YIKFKNSSEQYQSWLTSGINFQLDELNWILGNNQCKPLISDASLHLLSRRLPQNNLISSISYSPVENLRRICLVEYSSDIDPQLAAAKISSYDFVEYAEPVPVKRIVGVPNDSLIYKQYYLNQINVFYAWDIIEPDSSIVIGIVDTGIDYDHEDMKDKIWTNPGETGTDNDGNDKKSNGIDDDDNGFIDDWRGWDFVSSDDPDGDNDPHPGHVHGTHVAGIAAATTGNVRGIAGIARGARLMPVKVGSDNPFSTAVSNSYEGILYAAGMGADVINCSWGSGSRSESEMEILTVAASLGSVIVAAAGNDGDNVAFFPSGHEDVISVASVDSYDERSSFSNYHHTVDVASPGEDIYSSIPGNEYDYMDGTSMASPVVAGIAALVRSRFPDYIPLQVKEHLKASSDNIDSLNPYFVGKIGRGRVNALKAIQPDELKSLVLENYTVTDENNDRILDNNEKIEINISVRNVLSALGNARIEASFSSVYQPEFINSEVIIGPMNTLELKNVSQPFSFIVPAELPVNYEMLLELLFYDDDEYINSEFITLIFHPSYRTMDANDITVTFNDKGNIAFNDYPGNFQGDGFHYKSGPNILYEGALMIGIPPGKVSNVARGSQQMTQDRSFNSTESFSVINPGSIAPEEGYANFSSVMSDVEVAVKVNQSVYQFDDELNRNMIIVVYDIINIPVIKYDSLGVPVDTVSVQYDSLFAGLYFDWDVGPSGSNNFAKFDDSYGFGYVKSKAIDTLPYAGVAMLSRHKLNFFAVDNSGTSPSNPGVWDGFTRYEKWLMLSSGISRKESSVTDVSIVIGAGPIKLQPGDTTRIAFSLFSEYNYDRLRETCRKSRETAKEYNIADGEYNPLPESNSIMVVYPNPATGEELKVDFTLTNTTFLTIEIFNSIGQKILTPLKDRFMTAGYQSETIKLPGLAQGRYYLRISTNTERMIEPFEVIY
ncbi:S8 family serine peptidase, partial [Bacteroidota bacterium]